MKVRNDGTRNIHNFLAKIKCMYLTCKTKTHTNNITFFLSTKPSIPLENLAKIKCQLS
jgi:hypothetical protein